MTPETENRAAKVDRAKEKLKLWFFRDMNDEQRLKLFSLFGLPTDEIGKTHGHQSHALKHVLNALTGSSLAPATRAMPGDTVEVPREPTEAMLHAVSGMSFSGPYLGSNDARDIWDAMAAASR
ncbi:hypothetical protein EOB36_20490 [Mesorhizobium sp. M6A.T.Cr.TU.017.01.1.1]|uniref:hypothetical protein n=1 Tax=Mesorhizobium sp. M6A.T.Cr.TU.017.01.1.1 TaxID=2496774 RepID=UPI000FD288F1|nr:hypothetical protein [Mesorhizobium sp. M6A.T.Cr.TU.017.01.1.1]RUU99458.1 hypothetical protein EOB36_20490 [Mesorhizobium sp. M6A.T.Cr.TU.017.01.1.1]